MPTACQNLFRWFLFAIVVVSVSTASALAQTTKIGTVTYQHVMIPMRDGVRLSAHLYLPEGEGPWPVIFEQRYASFDAKATHEQMAKLAEAGYVVAGANFRGSQKSEGAWVGYRALGWGELQDGYDICEWLASQPWSTGKVGTFGSSQGGFAQNFLAVTRPPHLVCQYMIDTGLSLFHEGYRIGGCSRPQRFQAMGQVARDPNDNQKLLEEWYRHPNYDDYWRQEDCSLHFAKMNVPCFTIGSWYDFMCVGSIDSFVGRQHHGDEKSRGQQKLVIGPWLHGRYNKQNKVGELTYPDNANFDVQQSMIRWFDYHLKGIANGVMDEPNVRYYVMGAVDNADAPGNTWRSSQDWPPAATETAYYLQPDAGLSTSKPPADGGVSEYLADPQHPMEIPTRAFPGAQDARPFEQQAQVRTFTTEPLEQPVEWTGRVWAEIVVSSDAPDGDFIVRVSDVYPDGRSILVIDYVLCARYREGFDKQVFLEADRPTTLRFPVGWLSQIFAPGHRIRVTVASTGAPFYEPNPNTGAPLSLETNEYRVARNKIHHSAKFASRVLAPVANP